MKRMRILNGIILIAATMLLSSCFVAKDYVRPELQELNNLYRTENLPSDSLSMATLSWKEIFTDPYLRRYIEEGLSNNMDIRIAVQQMLAAEAYAKQGRAGYLPALNAGASVTHQELAKNSQFGSFFNGSLDQFELTGNLSWEADIWGKIRSNKRAVQAAYMQSVAGHQVVKTLLVANIAATYYNLLALDAQLN
ncbi:MAG: TolC family protein, partial [Flavobacteriaceae bacterium]|nr:TolC family protein [Flavobacteriaceae bacterium]